MGDWVVVEVVVVQLLRSIADSAFPFEQTALFKYTKLPLLPASQPKELHELSLRLQSSGSIILGHSYTVDM